MKLRKLKSRMNQKFRTNRIKRLQELMDLQKSLFKNKKEYSSLMRIISKYPWWDAVAIYKEKVAYENL